MKIIILILLILLVIAIPSIAQQYLLAGFGVNALLINSDDLDQFTSTYNAVNQSSLSGPFKGLNDAFGIGFNGGYLYLGKYSAAAFLGYQTFNEKTVAQYANGESRKLELKINHFYLEGQFGRTWDNLFLNGVAIIYIDRQLSLESSYLAVQPTPKSLDGTYSASNPVSIDLGLAFGLHRKPLLLVGRISYPVYTTTDPDVLTDSNPSKVADNTHIFPDDYFAYDVNEPYDGVSGKINGLKISISAYFALKFRD